MGAFLEAFIWTLSYLEVFYFKNLPEWLIHMSLLHKFNYISW